MVLLSIPIPLQSFVIVFIGPPLVQLLPDPQPPFGWVESTLPVIKAADPARSRVVFTVAAKYGVDLIHEAQGEMGIGFIVCLLRKPEEIAEGKCVGPQIPLWAKLPAWGKSGQGRKLIHECPGLRPRRIFLHCFSSANALTASHESYK
jgi:hypothetical protein